MNTLNQWCSAFRIVALGTAISVAMPVFAEEVKAIEPDKTVGDKILVPDAPKADEQAAPAPAIAPYTPSQTASALELQRSEWFTTYMSVIHDFTSAMGGKDDPKSQVEFLSSFKFSDSTKEKLQHFFGNDDPLHITRQLQKDGKTRLDYLIDPLEHDDPADHAKFHWSGLSGRTVFDKSFKTSEGHFESDTLSIENEDFRISANALKASQHAQYGSDGLWTGKSEVNVANVQLDSKTLPNGLRLDDLTLGLNVKNAGKFIHFDYDFGIRKIDWGKDSVSDSRFAFNLTHLDRKDLQAFVKQARVMGRQRKAGEVVSKESVNLLLNTGKSILLHGATFELVDLSTRFHGLTVAAAGKASFKGLTKDDMDSWNKIIKKAVMRFDAHAPVAFADEIAKLFVPRDPASHLTDQQYADQVHGVVQKMLNSPKFAQWFRVENGQILSTFEYKSGKFLVNGKERGLPGVPVPAHK